MNRFGVEIGLGHAAQTINIASITSLHVEAVGQRIGSAVEESEPRYMDVRGRNMVTGLPKTARLSSEEMRIALRDVTGQVVEAVHSVLEKTPPELAADIVNRGIVVTGGGALLYGMDILIEQQTGVHAMTIRDALTAAVIGTGKYAEVMG